MQTEQQKNRILRLMPTRFKNGQSGNPGGRAKGRKDGLRAVLRRALRKCPTESITKVLLANGIEVKHLRDQSNAEAIIAVLLAAGVAGNIEAIRLIFAQAEGPLRPTDDMPPPTTILVDIPGLPVSPDAAAPRQVPATLEI